MDINKNEDSARHNLVDKLYEISKQCGDKGSLYPACMGCVADFILEDRRRIVSPLITSREKCSQLVINDYDFAMKANALRRNAIDETLKNTGIE